MVFPATAAPKKDIAVRLFCQQNFNWRKSGAAAGLRHGEAVSPSGTNPSVGGAVGIDLTRAPEREAVAHGD